MGSRRAQHEVGHQSRPGLSLEGQEGRSEMEMEEPGPGEAGGMMGASQEDLEVQEEG